MSGNGKSSLIQMFRVNSYKAIDMDEPGWSEYRDDGEWIWNEHHLKEFLNTDKSDVLIIAGCAINQGKFYPQLDQIILLSAPANVLLERLKNRTNNSYGKRSEEINNILDDLENIEPLLRQGATHEISTATSLEDVYNKILSLINSE